MRINNFMDILLYQIGRNSYGQGISFKTLKIIVFIIILIFVILGIIFWLSNRNDKNKYPR